MKHIAAFIFWICLSSSQSLLSQQKLDYVWPLGFGPALQSPTTGIVQGGMLMNFNSSPPALSLHSFESDYIKAGICDTSGQLLAYTDGCRIYNRNHVLMLNGDTLNPGKVFKSFCALGGYPVWQACLFLPDPGNSDHYYLLHLRKDDWLWNPMDFMYSIVDAKGDNGLGEAITKNNIVFSDSIWLGNYISATRHANGRDWWLLAPRRVKNDYHLCLLTPGGIEYQGMQTIGDTSYNYCCGQTDFSPDGSKFFRHWPEGLQILDFDRCSGVLSNPLYIDYSDYPAAGGVAVSPNGRFLYAPKGAFVHQYDLWADDIAASRITVAEYDGFVSPFETYFFQARLAPDGKIYIVSTNTNNILHVIHNPDSLGLACNVEQHGVILPALTSYLMPNFANYRLYDLPGSPCDTLGIDTPASVAAQEPKTTDAALEIAPNPADGRLVLQWKTREKGWIAVSDLRGKVWLTALVHADQGSLAFNTQNLYPGIYFVSFRSESGQVVTRKLVVQH